MRSTSLLASTSRRCLVISSFALAVALAPAALLAQPPPAQPPPAQTPPAQTPPAGQTPPAQTPPAQTPAAPTALTFSGPAGMIFNPIKPDKAADFEEAIGKFREALGKSTKPERKQQAASWKVYKAAEPMGANTLYVFIMDPAVAGADYNFFPILQEGLGDAPAREVFDKLRNAFAGPQSKINLTPLAPLAPVGGGL